MSDDNSDSAGSRGDDASTVGGAGVLDIAGAAQGPEGGARGSAVSSDEMDAHSSGNETNSNSSCHDKDSGVLLETTESNKRCVCVCVQTRIARLLPAAPSRTVC
ncbi:UNVERIFIED_CONTAM: hypothetical protein FKN15_041754 [Acipenser sinensis]